MEMEFNQHVPNSKKKPKLGCTNSYTYYLYYQKSIHYVCPFNTWRTAKFSVIIYALVNKYLRMYQRQSYLGIWFLQRFAYCDIIANIWYYGTILITSMQKFVCCCITAMIPIIHSVFKVITISSSSINSVFTSRK